VRAKVLRFETASPEPLAELLLVSTLSVAGPVQFVARKTYQVGATAVCDPPVRVYLVERRDLYRVPTATPVTIGSPSMVELPLYSMDLSLGGLRICPPLPLEVGAEVQVQLDLSAGTVINLKAVVRHCRPLGDDTSEAHGPARPVAGAGAGPGGRKADSAADARRSVAGLQFIEVPTDIERQLSSFLGRHQRRLMPRVEVTVPIEYRSHGRSRFIEAVAKELSPGDMLVVLYERHFPGDRMELQLRLRHQDFHFTSCAITSTLTSEPEGAPVRHLVRASLDDAGEAVETKFRQAVRDLAVERIGSRRR
jgi:hypothetical protein